MKIAFLARASVVFNSCPIIGHQKVAQVNFATYKTVFKQYQRLPTSVDALKTNYFWKAYCIDQFKQTSEHYIDLNLKHKISSYYLIKHKRSLLLYSSDT